MAARETNTARLRRERDEALEHQRVTSEILRVISDSPTDSISTLGAIAESIARLIGVTDANMPICKRKIASSRREQCMRGNMDTERSLPFRCCEKDQQSEPS
jgi:hypothetical protein